MCGHPGTLWRVIVAALSVRFSSNCRGTVGTRLCLPQAVNQRLYAREDARDLDTIEYIFDSVYYAGRDLAGRRGVCGPSPGPRAPSALSATGSISTRRAPARLSRGRAGWRAAEPGHRGGRIGGRRVVRGG